MTKKYKNNCSVCKATIYRDRKNRSGNYYCSYECRSKARKGPTVTTPCGHCEKVLTKPLRILEQNVSKKIFCNQKCAKAYNSAHRKHSNGTSITVTCANCKKPIKRRPSQIRKSKTKKFCCSRKCRGELRQSPLVETFCGQCGKQLTIKKWKLDNNISGKAFCNQKCAKKYNGVHRRKTFRSKTEKYLENLIRKEFPQLLLQTNNCTYVGLELDLFMPQILFAIEVNGPLHYEPIYGEEQLKSIQERDRNKYDLCMEKMIDLRVLRAYELNEKFLTDLFNLEIAPLIKEKIANNTLEF